MRFNTLSDVVDDNGHTVTRTDPIAGQPGQAHAKRIESQIRAGNGEIPQVRRSRRAVCGFCRSRR